MTHRPGLLAVLLTLAVGGGLAVGVYRIPVQVSDSLEIIETMEKAPTATTAFTEALHTSRTMLRPMRQWQTRVLLTLAQATGGAYHLVYRGYHAVTVFVCIAVFAWLAWRHTRGDLAAFAFGVMVLIGMHTFPGTLREAYPVNHFLLIALYGLLMSALVQSRGGWLVDLAAVLLFAVAALTLESGLLLAVIALAGYLAGWRGISRRGLALLAVAGVAYVALRNFGLHMEPAAVGSRQTGYWAQMLSTADLEARFGAHPWPLYAYTVVMSMVSVLLSQPSHGQWTVAEAALRGAYPPVYALEMLTTLATTALIAWYITRVGEDGRRRWREPLPLVTLALLVSNALISFAYAKNEIISLTGVFYALLAAVALGHWLAVPRAAGEMRRAIVVLALVSVGWAMRDVGLHAKLLRSAFDARDEWGTVLTPGNAGLTPIAAALGEDALIRRAEPASRMPYAWLRWWEPK